MGQLIGGIMVEDDFTREAFEEISEDERTQILANAKVVSALKNQTGKFGTIRVGEEDVRFRLGISKKLRTTLSLLKSKISVSEPGTTELDSTMYNVLSHLCVDEPWTDWKTWSVYDDTADVGALDILLEVMTQIKDHIEDVKSFRGKPRRINAVEDLQVPVVPPKGSP